MEGTRHRVVATGLGVISSLGEDLSQFWANLTAGRSGVRRITLFDPSQFSCQIAGELPAWEPERYMDRKQARKTARFAQMAIGAARLAVEHAGLASAIAAESERVGVLVGSGIGGIEVTEEQVLVLHQQGARRMSPFFIPMMIPDMAAGMVSIELGLRGPNWTAVSACASGLHAIGEAMRTLRNGDADVVLAGGTEGAVTPAGLGGFAAMRALSTRNAEPERASRPFDRDRDGFVMGEGAAILVLETLEHARGRGARILAEMVGYGATADAYHITSPAPGGEGAARCMNRALADAGLAPSAVDYINAHGTSTPLNDKFETQAIRRVFGEHAHKLAVSSTKSMTGHLLGAAGALEMVVCILTMLEQVAPPTINYETPDPECDLDYVPNRARPIAARIALNNALGFGGHNATVIARRWDGAEAPA